jgi:hypothetical protein
MCLVTCRANLKPVAVYSSFNSGDGACRCADEAYFYAQDLITCGLLDDTPCPTGEESPNAHSVFCAEEACAALSDGIKEDPSWEAAWNPAVAEWHMG